jgi:hypothetical protein
MKRIIMIATSTVALLAAGLALADTIKDRRWIKGPDSTATYTEWRSIDSLLDCTYGSWNMQTLSDGSRVITRTKSCAGTETMKLGVFPQ